MYSFLQSLHKEQFVIVLRILGEKLSFVATLKKEETTTAEAKILHIVDKYELI